MYKIIVRIIIYKTARYMQMSYCEFTVGGKKKYWKKRWCVLLPSKNFCYFEGKYVSICNGLEF